MTSGLASAAQQSKHRNTTQKLSFHIFSVLPLFYLFFFSAFWGFFKYCSNLPKKSPNVDVHSVTRGDMKEKCDQPQYRDRLLSWAGSTL